MEMAFQEHYHEVLNVLGALFTHIFNGLKTQYADELAAINRQYPFEEFKFPQTPLILEFSEGIKMLREAGVTIGDFDDMNTETERTLGRLVKEKYDTDFYMVRIAHTARQVPACNSSVLHYA
jgi:aspartyl-tRNA synthetase